MANPDLLNGSIRKDIIQEIKSQDNKDRKNEHLKRHEIYRQRQDRFIIEKLQEEFSSKTVDDMRKIKGINIAKRIIDQQASLYVKSPERNFSNASERELEQLENIYSINNVNTKMKLANRYFKLANGQVAIQIVPKKGKIQLRPLMRQMYDVIPDFEDPEQPFAYIVSTMDRFNFLQNTVPGTGDGKRKIVNESTSAIPNKINETIADEDDYQSRLERFEVWTDEINFIMDGRGEIVSDVQFIQNPIGRLPFVDISSDKDYEFFVRSGSGVTDFSIEFSAMLSDVANISRLQGYAQAVVTADKQPENMVIGPNHVLFMKIDPARPEITPRFDFVSPSPDLQGSMSLLDKTINIWLSSLGQDTGTITSSEAGPRFNSGVDRLLHMIEKFEATEEDMDVFANAENEIFNIIRDWSNLFQGVQDGLDEKFNVSRLNENIEMEIQYQKPTLEQSKEEKEASVERLLKMGLLSKKEAIMELREVNEEMAEEILKEIEDDKRIRVPLALVENIRDGQNNQGSDEGSDGQQSEAEA